MNAHIDFAAVKTRQQAAWGSGDYAVIGTTLQIVGEQLAEACDLRWDERVLDVAAGNGNATLAAARRGCVVTSTDYVPDCSSAGAERARAERLDVRFQLADAEALPFDDASFDAVLSTFGVMFAPDHAQAAAETGCACAARAAASAWRTGRPKASSASCSRPSAAICRRRPACSRRRCGAPRPTSTAVRRRGAASIYVTPRIFNFRYRSAAHFIEVFRTWYGPVHKAFVALAADKAQALERDLTSCWTAESRRRRFAGRAERIPRNRRHAALSAMNLLNRTPGVSRR